ncbi:hypothetical protein BN971_02211 [Mycobacterium bohemicum DSM 44277]|uniref:Uncharacterized protein n=2 Tax=Mycobacterium bohemicum TaxID=56425 RepID=A0A1X1QVS4_MYCBE|nr:hypothetical protein [Mycobacterium bohemicum]MCV6969841.1 hypothetical protein [Mycobacterium bohemicum]ORU95480.1 hypothetical protein AWB93_24160 [Mycobacterium bohemicum]CPR10936.1 hypothetical protein BN971_02211 [Mycobacterium bohemicum DSM 44277]
MILTGAFLAEAAATVDNKLNVSGGVVSRFVVGPDRWVSLVLVVLTRADSGDGEKDAGHTVDVEIKPPTLDNSAHQRFELPDASIGEFPGYAFFDIQVQLPYDGRWSVEVTGGGQTISLPLLVESWTPPSDI